MALLGALLAACLLPPQARAAEYPELARLGPAEYCNPYFGFRLPLPPAIHSERYYRPNPPEGRHMLLALNLWRLDHSAELFITSFEDATPDAAGLAAHARLKQQKQVYFSASMPPPIEVAGHKIYRLKAEGDAHLGYASTWFVELRGSVVVISLHSREPGLEPAVAAAVEHMTFFAPGAEACAAGDLYYGPALPSALVEETIARAPGRSVPAGELQAGEYVAPALGLRVGMPPRWVPLSVEEREGLPELLAEPAPSRRHQLLRACSRVLFAAVDPLVEPVSGVHPSLGLLALPRGCVPDLLPPPLDAGREAEMEFGDLLLLSLGFAANDEWKLYHEGGLHHLDGVMPYHVPGEEMTRRLTVRVSVASRGDYLVLLYTVTTSPSEQRRLGEHIHFSAEP